MTEESIKISDDSIDSVSIVSDKSSDPEFESRNQCIENISPLGKQEKDVKEKPFSYSALISKQSQTKLQEAV